MSIDDVVQAGSIQCFEAWHEHSEQRQWELYRWRISEIQSLEQRIAADESRIYDLQQLLETACDAWECGTPTTEDGIYFHKAYLPRAWYDAAKKATADG